ncbi:MAG: hypothetical protein IJT16_11570 [Lachnospiraceae bacterium]|nr:hypothetical protein [Lachnospiraceae bacterium]
MFCKGVESYSYDTDGKRHVVADLRASTVPATMPETGEDIDKLDGNDILDPGTTLYIINTGALYMMNEENEFKEQ